MSAGAGSLNVQGERGLVKKIRDGGVQGSYSNFEEKYYLNVK